MPKYPVYPELPEHSTPDAWLFHAVPVTATRVWHATTKGEPMKCNDVSDQTLSNPVEQ